VPIRIHRVALGLPALAIHGGAGTRTTTTDPAAEAAEVAGLERSLEAGWSVLCDGGSALEAVTAAVVSMEDSGVFNAGRGSVPTSAGQVETDAAVMGLGRDGEGTWREISGAACAMTWPANPVLVARAVAEAGDAVLLAGAGADDFAESAGLTKRDEAQLTHGGTAPVSQMGTVGAVAVDRHGHLAAATSTGGRTGQPPGRVGDSPVIGAGTWAAEGGVAVSATGDGEAFIRAGFAHRIEAAFRSGTDLQQAARHALEAAERWNGTGGAIVLSPAGELVVLCDTPSMARGWRADATTVAELIGPNQGA
jgi:isoaspartyl peptidase/L-asparaginase-like protein (Ntn-hydrolase superfamily)